MRPAGSATSSAGKRMVQRRSAQAERIRGVEGGVGVAQSGGQCGQNRRERLQLQDGRNGLAMSVVLDLAVACLLAR